MNYSDFLGFVQICLIVFVPFILRALEIPRLIKKRIEFMGGKYLYKKKYYPMLSKGPNPFPNKFIGWKGANDIYEVFYEIDGHVKSIYVHIGLVNVQWKYKNCSND